MTSVYKSGDLESCTSLFTRISADRGASLQKGEKNLSTPPSSPPIVSYAVVLQEVTADKERYVTAQIYTMETESNVAQNSGDLDKNRVRPNKIFSKDF